MIIRFTASNIVAMIFFIPLLLLLGLIMAFLVPLFALIIAAASILFLGMYAFAKVGLVKRQRIRIGDTSRLGKQKVSIGGSSGKMEQKKKTSSIEVKDYKVR